MEEEWRSVVGTEGFYEVSSFGRMRSTERTFGARSYPSKILATRFGKSGYMRVNMSVHGQHMTRMVHRIVAEAFIGPKPTGCVVDHIDRNRVNNHARNLRYIATSENTRKLTDSAIREAKRLLSAGWSQVRIAATIGHGQSVISEIKRGRRWTEVR